jgi:hypothetical protein
VYLFPKVLQDSKEYRRAESFWRERFDHLVETLRQEADWVSPWITPKFSDGSACRDGNPIFSAICPVRRRGVRLIQLEPGVPNALSFWTDTFDSGGPAAIDELVISCVPTYESVLLILDLLRQWISEGTVRWSRHGYVPTFTSSGDASQRERYDLAAGMNV